MSALNWPRSTSIFAISLMMPTRQDIVWNFAVLKSQFVCVYSRPYMHGYRYSAQVYQYKLRLYEQRLFCVIIRSPIANTLSIMKHDRPIMPCSTTKSSDQLYCPIQNDWPIKFSFTDNTLVCMTFSVYQDESATFNSRFHPFWSYSICLGVFVDAICR